MSELLPCPYCDTDGWLLPEYANAPAAPDPAPMASLAEWRQSAETQDAIIQRGATPTDPALLALARLGAEVAHWVSNDPSADVETEYLNLTGVMDNDRRWYRPGIADAINALLAPDQHEGVADGD